MVIAEIKPAFFFITIRAEYKTSFEFDNINLDLFIQYA